MPVQANLCPDKGNLIILESHQSARNGHDTRQMNSALNNKCRQTATKCIETLMHGPAKF